MIKLGVCTSWDNIENAAALGFDFIESGLATLAALTDEQFEAVKAKVRGASIPMLALNGMVPGDIRLTGAEVDRDAIIKYLNKALSRAGRLGVQTVVFGSGGARRVPDGFPMDQAWRQLAEYLMITDPIAARHGIVIAIEPLRRRECNIVNLVAEGMALASLVNLPNIRVLGDTFHMECVGEPLSALTAAGAMLRHVHVSHSLGDDGGRVFPAPGDDEDYAALFDVLTAMGYTGGVSIEAGCKDFMIDGAKALEALKAAQGRCP